MVKLIVARVHHGGDAPQDALPAAGGEERHPGGEGFEHFDPLPSVMTVPWIACGPGIRCGQRIGNPVSVLDTIPTAAAILGVDPVPSWEGRVLNEIFE